MLCFFAAMSSPHPGSAHRTVDVLSYRCFAALLTSITSRRYARPSLRLLLQSVDHDVVPVCDLNPAAVSGDNAGRSLRLLPEYALTLDAWGVALSHACEGKVDCATTSWARATTLESGYMLASHTHLLCPPHHFHCHSHCRHQLCPRYFHQDVRRRRGGGESPLCKAGGFSH